LKKIIQDAQSTKHKTLPLPLQERTKPDTRH